MGSPELISGPANADRWRSLPRVRRHRASSSPCEVVPVTGAAFRGITVNHLICASIFPHQVVTDMCDYIRGGYRYFTTCVYSIPVYFFVCVSLMADGSQHARLPIPPTATLPSCLWSQRIFPSLPVSRPTNFYRDASSALLQLVNQWLNFTYSRSHAFRYGR